MDIATIIGIVAAFGLVIGSMSMGGSIGMFVNGPAILIVVGGTLGATLVAYPLKDMIGTGAVLKNAFFAKANEPSSLIRQIVDFANRARREGMLALDSVLSEIESDFTRKAFQLAVDGQAPNAIERILSTEIDYLKERHKLGAEILTTMATFAPALGLIGTLIGLVQMLANMEDPSSIGPAMAIALLTTFYGAILANLVFSPMSTKLKKRSGEEVLTMEMVVEGVLAISAGDNPRIVEQKLCSFVSPRLRASGQEGK